MTATKEELGLPFTAIESERGAFLILGHNGRAGTANSEELARYFITAANNHHALVEALGEMVACFEAQPACEGDVELAARKLSAHECARAALAAVKGGE